jgi:hypothetical protein
MAQLPSEGSTMARGEMPPETMSREAATGTDYAALWDTPASWPRHVRRMSLDEMDFGIDPKSDVVYYRGRPLQFEQIISLNAVQFAVAVIGVLAALVAALWPVGVAYGWWGACHAIIAAPGLCPS